MKQKIIELKDKFRQIHNFTTVVGLNSPPKQLIEQLDKPAMIQEECTKVPSSIKINWDLENTSPHTTTYIFYFSWNMYYNSHILGYELSVNRFKIKLYRNIFLDHNGVTLKTNIRQKYEVCLPPLGNNTILL